MLVPVLNRPQNVEPLIDSFKRGCPDDSHLYFIATLGDEDERDALMGIAPELTNIHSFSVSEELGSWPSKINKGVEMVQANWYLFAADDVTFTPGWWERTKELRDDPLIGVIGTNDSAAGRGNPRVAAGEHTCHPLVRAAYIRDHGTADAKGKAVHEGYRHWCVDDELVWTAKLRHAWAFCRDAVIEHHHPYWTPGMDWDSTYALGESKAKEDMALWAYRAKHVLGLTAQ